VLKDTLGALKDTPDGRLAHARQHTARGLRDANPTSCAQRLAFAGK